MCKHCKEVHNLTNKKSFETNCALAELMKILNKNNEVNSLESPKTHPQTQPQAYSATVTPNTETTKTNNQNGVLRELVQNLTRRKRLNDNADTASSLDTLDEPEIAKKLNRLNNDLHLNIIDFASYNDKSMVTVSVGLISKNMILFVDEKIYGKVRSTRLRIINHENRVLRTSEVCQQLEIYRTLCVCANSILLVFEDCRANFLVKLFDLNLNFKFEKRLKFELSSVLMSDTRIYLICQTDLKLFSLSTKPIVHEYDLELKKLQAFGQNTKEKRRYFVRGEIVAITSEKISVKDRNEIRIINYASGEFLYKFTFDGIVQSKIYLEHFTGNYLIWNGYKKFIYLDSLGNEIIHNKLRLYERYAFNEFQLCNSGCFGLINFERSFIVIF